MKTDVREIDGAIAELERNELNNSRATLLAALYIIRNQFTEYSDGYQFEPVGRNNNFDYRLEQYGESEFLQVVAGKNAADAWKVMDELMSTLEVLNVKIYDSVMRKLAVL